jgi:hypothetical protein
MCRFSNRLYAATNGGIAGLEPRSTTLYRHILGINRLVEIVEVTEPS